MQFRRYCVTVMDNWTPMRLFWTYRRARRWKDSHGDHAHLYRWIPNVWRKVCLRCDGQGTRLGDGCPYCGGCGMEHSR